jgi:predicted thioesterase
MVIEIKPGLSAQAETVVEMKDTAKAVASGLAEVYATPMMIALMEKAAYTAVQSQLPEGYSTVGIHISASHLAATPVGVKVWAKATLVETDGKRLTFDIEAFDERDKIGEARHERFIIEESRFLKKAYAKAQKQ